MDYTCWGDVLLALRYERLLCRRLAVIDAERRHQNKLFFLSSTQIANLQCYAMKEEMLSSDSLNTK
jgi:hypothetical protein